MKRRIRVGDTVITPDGVEAQVLSYDRKKDKWLVKRWLLGVDAEADLIIEYDEKELERKARPARR